jgi:peroxiredoxin
MHPPPAIRSTSAQATADGAAAPGRRRLLQLGGALALALGAPLAKSAPAVGRALPGSADAPDFTLPLSTGGNLRLLEQRGQVVMLNFWASWCAPCQREMPHLDRLYGRYRPSGFLLLGVNVDEDARNAEVVRSRLALRFPVLLDSRRDVSRAYGLATMPSTVLIDRDGRVRFRNAGYHEGSEETYEKQVRELLKG